VAKNKHKQPNEDEMMTSDDKKKKYGEFIAKNILALSFIHQGRAPTIISLVYGCNNCP